MLRYISELFRDELFSHLFTIILTIILASILAKVLKMFSAKAIHASSKFLNVDETNYKFLKNAINFIVVIIAVIVIFYSIPVLRNLGLTLLASAGIFAAILGLASQQAFSNIISGIFIVIFKPFRVGDVIKVNENSGVIEDITLRHTVIRNFENRRLIIPNSVISSETILNSSITDTKICNFFEFGISYDSDIDKAKSLVREEAEKHRSLIDNRSEEEITNGNPVVDIKVLGYGDSSVNMRAYLWSNSPAEGFILKCDLYESVKKRFDKEGVEIPFPYRTVVFKNKNEKPEE